MKQIVQNYGTGALYLEHVPVPLCKAGGILVRTAYSLVSTGTERMKVDQARMGLIAKARARPDKVKQVIKSVREIGLSETVNKVRERLDTLTPLGYSVVGLVEEVGAGVDDVRIGDRVACAGEGIAMHAEFVSVPQNLYVRIPEGVNLKDAAFSTVGAIALNGVRQAGATLGDCVAVIGLGLVGLLATQILKAAGCRVIGIDLDADKVALAKVCGADVAMMRGDSALEPTLQQATGGAGADVAYIAASTKSADPMELAARILRDRGKVVVVGMVPVCADWQTCYEKELSFVMSRSYGPGRYDPQYEQSGIDYPIGYVRWTERRNIEEFLRLLSTGAVQPSRLAPALFKFADAARAYQELHESPAKHPGGILFEYDCDASVRRSIFVSNVRTTSKRHDTVGVGLIGAGNFATSTLIPALKKASGVRLVSVCSAGGLSAASAARRHGFEHCASDYREILENPHIDAVLIATRHDTHAALACEALKAGKHVFVEKPLALSREELEQIVAAKADANRIVMPGFNRRFSPIAAAIRGMFASRTNPLQIVCRVNAGALDHDSWYRDRDQGGWRIISEGCHFVDLIQFIAASPARRVFAEMVSGETRGAQNDNCSAVIRLADGSIATLIYTASGDVSTGKERIEVFGDGMSAVIDNWKAAHLTTGAKTRRLGAAGKGHTEEIAAFIDAIRRGGEGPLLFEDAVSASVTTFAIEESLLSGQMVECSEVSDSRTTVQDEPTRGERAAAIH